MKKQYSTTCPQKIKISGLSFIFVKYIDITLKINHVLAPKIKEKIIYIILFELQITLNI